MNNQLATILSEDTIKLNLKSEKRDDAIRELVELLYNTGAFNDKEKIFSSVLDRERLITTGIGNGVAIPHCKSPLCKEFVLALGISDKGIDFSSFDRVPVHIIFLLVGPDKTTGAHIKALSRISRIMNKKDAREKLMLIKGKKELHQFLVKEEQQSFS